MNKWKQYLHRLSSGKSKRNEKKNLAQSSISVEPPHLTSKNDILRNSISLDSASNSSKCDVVDELFSHKVTESTSQSTKDKSPDNNIPNPGMPENGHSVSSSEHFHPLCSKRNYHKTQNKSNSTSTWASSPESPISPVPLFLRTIDEPFPTNLVASPPAYKHRQTTDGYIPLDTCSSGKIPSGNRFEEERNRNSTSYLNVDVFPGRAVSEHLEPPGRPFVHYLETIPPTPKRMGPPPRPMKSTASFLANHHMRKHFSADVGEMKHCHHNSFHGFPEKQPRETDGENVECDNNNNECERSFCRGRDKYEDKGYYNESVCSLQKSGRKQLTSYSSNGSVNMKYTGIDKDSKDLLKHVPVAAASTTRYPSHTGGPRTANKRSLDKTFPIDESLISHCRGESEFNNEFPLAPRIHKNSVSSLSKKLPPSFEGVDNLDGSSSFSNEDSNSVSESFQDKLIQEWPPISNNFEVQRKICELNYLLLDLETTSESSKAFISNRNELDHDSIYSIIDCLKTKALQDTMNDRSKGKGAPLILT